MLSLEWRPRAQLDRESIALYLGFERDNPQAALKVVGEIDRVLDQARELPGIGKPFQHEALEGAGYRQLLVGSYVVLYRNDERVLTVYRVLHQRQDIDDYALVEFVH
ncbi:MAG: type II toxin-antitoxin system RelE/ParE family toxin [Coriobacteriia bacterium]|nr:type II toxin-antitoxin system RelE/ParE family toxin [Coriobacteriia bacterium]